MASTSYQTPSAGHDEVNLPVRFSFVGTGLQCLGWGLVLFILSAFVVPAAWGWADFTRWFFRSIRLSDGTSVRFTGRGSQIWYVPILLAVVSSLVPKLERTVAIAPWWTLKVSLAPTLIKLFPVVSPLQIDFSGSELPLVPVIVLTLWVLVLLLASCLWVAVLKWIFRNVILGCGTTLDFTGTYLQYLGWSVLVGLSFVTIVGWAWAILGMTRWLLDNVNSPGNRLVFYGTGGELLWRGFLLVIVSIVTLGIGFPWMFVWVCRWGASKLYVEPLPEAA